MNATSTHCFKKHHPSRQQVPNSILLVFLHIVCNHGPPHHVSNCEEIRCLNKERRVGIRQRQKLSRDWRRSSLSSYQLSLPSPWQSVAVSDWLTKHCARVSARAPTTPMLKANGEGFEPLGTDGALASIKRKLMIPTRL